MLPTRSTGEQQKAAEELPEETKKLELAEGIKNLDTQEETENLELPKETKNSESPQEIEILELPEETENAELSEGTENSEVPEEIKNSASPDETKKLELAKTTKDLELPEETKNLELPEETENAELLEETKNSEVVEEIKNLASPEETKNLELAKTTKDLEMPEETKNLDLAEMKENSELPEETNKLELPGDTEKSELPQDTKNAELLDETKNAEFPEETKNSGLPEEAKKPKLLEETKNLESQEEIKSLVSFGMEDMPNEVLQNIFNRFERKNELLSFRNVCRRWASNVSEVIGARTNAQFSKWKEVTGPEPDRNEYPVPKLMVAPANRKVIAKVIFPHNLTKTLNPFPTLSISLVSIGVDDGVDPNNLQPGQFKFFLRKLIWNHGANLKVLHIHGTAFLFPKPDTIFPQLPNLKTLKVKECTLTSAVSMGSITCTIPGKSFPILKNLTVRFCNEYFANWLIKAFATTLETIELGSAFARPFTRINYYQTDSFKNLKHMKLYDFDEKFVTAPQGNWIELKNLERLSISLYHGSAKHMPHFLSKYKDTLVELSYDKRVLHVSRFLRGSANTDGGDQRLVFPKVETFCITILNPKELKRETAMISSSFPNLKTLQLVDYAETSRETAFVVCDIAETFQYCPSVNSIEVLYNTGGPKYQLIRCHTFNREDL